MTTTIDKYRVMYQKKSSTATPLLLSRRANIPDTGHEKRMYLWPLSGNNNILVAGPPCEMPLAKRGGVNPIYTTLVLISITILNPAGDKGIIANPVTLKEYIIEIMRSEYRGIYDMERGSTEVGFEHNLESMKFRKFT